MCHVNGKLRGIQGGGGRALVFQEREPKTLVNPRRSNPLVPCGTAGAMTTQNGICCRRRLLITQRLRLLHKFPNTIPDELARQSGALHPPRPPGKSARILDEWN